MSAWMMFHSHPLGVGKTWLTLTKKVWRRSQAVPALICYCRWDAALPSGSFSCFSVALEEGSYELLISIQRGPQGGDHGWLLGTDQSFQMKRQQKIKSLVTLTAMRKGILPKNLIKSGEEGGRTLPQSRHHKRPQPGWSLKAAFWDSE